MISYNSRTYVTFTSKELSPSLMEWAKNCAHLFNKTNKNTFYFTVDQLVSWSSYWKVKRFGQYRVSLGLLLNNSLKDEGFRGIRS